MLILNITFHELQVVVRCKLLLSPKPRLLTHTCSAQNQNLQLQKSTEVQTDLWCGIVAGSQYHQGCTCCTVPLEQDRSSAHILPWALLQAGLLGSFPE